MSVNLGSVVGCLLGVAVIVGLFALNDWEFHRGLVKIGIFTVAGGGAAGGYLWNLFAGSKEEDVNPNAPPR